MTIQKPFSIIKVIYILEMVQFIVKFRRYERIKCRNKTLNTSLNNFYVIIILIIFPCNITRIAKLKNQV